MTDCKPLQMALSSSAMWKLLDDVTLRFPSATPRVVFVGHGQHLVRRMPPFGKGGQSVSGPQKKDINECDFPPQTVENDRILENLLERGKKTNTAMQAMNKMRQTNVIELRFIN